MQEDAPTILVQLHRAEQIEELVSQFGECAGLLLVAGCQPDMTLHAADMTIPDEISSELRQLQVDDIWNMDRLAPAEHELSDSRTAERVEIGGWLQCSVPLSHQTRSTKVFECLENDSCPWVG